MILTTAVLLYQLLFVAIMFIASRLGKLALHIALVCCLAWTATHVFLPLLAVVQTAVIVASFFAFRRRLYTRPAAAGPNSSGRP
jgi:hypothetical protein